MNDADRTSGIDTCDEAIARVAALLYSLAAATTDAEREYHVRIAFTAAQYDASVRQQAIATARFTEILAR